MNSGIYKNLALWLVIALMMVLVFNLFNTNTQTNQKLSYTEFLNSVANKEVKKVTMPKVNGKSCKGYIVKNGGFVINSDGSLIKDFETTLKNKYGDAIVYILYPFC